MNVHEAQTNFSKLLSLVQETGDRAVICRNGSPVADLVPHRTRGSLTPHPVMGKIEILYDPTEIATEEEWPKAYR